MIKAITFDFWSTLYISRPVDMAERRRFLQRAIEIRNGHQVAEVALAEAVDVARDAWNRAWWEEHRTMGAREWISIVLQALQIQLAEDHLSEIERALEEKLLANLPTLVAEAGAVLSELAQDYRLAIISDTGLSPGRVLRQILDQDAVSTYFTHFTFSDEIGCSKPHANAFFSTLEALEAQPHEAVHIGDLLRTDIAGAKGVGMRAVQYVGVNHDSAQIAVVPDAIIESHSQLSPLLQAWNESVG